MAKPIEVTEKNFEQVVLKATIPTVVDFWAVWCGPCKMIAPILEQIAYEQEGKLQVCKLDVDHNNELALKYGVMSIPTLIIFKDGQPVDRIVGFMPKEKLMSKITPHLAPEAKFGQVPYSNSQYGDLGRKFLSNLQEK